MNMTNLALDEFEVQIEIRKIGRKIRPLFPEYVDYEERKRELRKMNLSSWEFDKAIKELAAEFNL